MKSIISKVLLGIMLSLSIVGCDVHEFPGTPENVALRLRLNFETEMLKWSHVVEGSNVIEQGTGPVYDNIRNYGQIRYVVRAYPVTKAGRNYEYYTKEFIFTQDILDGYDFEDVIELPAGNYDIMVWSDIIQSTNDDWHYNPANFSEITLNGDYIGSNDYRDAFRGSAFITLESSVVEHDPATLDITMQRPLAKFELITNDLQEFYEKEIEYQEMLAASRGELPPSRVNTDNYTVVVNYVSHLPTTFNIFSDKPIDAAENMKFESKLNIVGSNEASLGFDYVLINGISGGMTIQVGFYDNEGRQIALSELIKVPLLRNRHSVLLGSFLIHKASGGLTINPDFGWPDNNIVIE